VGLKPVMTSCGLSRKRGCPVNLKRSFKIPCIGSSMSPSALAVGALPYFR
jgi:hypothetical protein